MGYETFISIYVDIIEQDFMKAINHKLFIWTPTFLFNLEVIALRLIWLMQIEGLYYFQTRSSIWSRETFNCHKHIAKHAHTISSTVTRN